MQQTTPTADKKEIVPEKAPDEDEALKKSEVRARYLEEKYATRWRHKMWKVPGVPLKLTQTTWLQQAMFSPSSQSARQTATRVIEYIAQVPSRKKEIVDMLTGQVLLFLIYFFPHNALRNKFLMPICYIQTFQNCFRDIDLPGRYLTFISS